MLDWPILSTVTFLPLVGAVLILLIRNDDGTRKPADPERRAVHHRGHLPAVARHLDRLRQQQSRFQFVEKADWLASGVAYHMGVDGISMLFVILTTFLMPICILASWDAIEHRVKEYMRVPDPRDLMIGVFCALDIVMFYVSSKAGLIRCSSSSASGAASGASTPRSSSSSIRCSARSDAARHHGDVTGRPAPQTSRSCWPYQFPVGMQHCCGSRFFASFAVKMPMWPVHTWLPDAHVEAPTAGPSASSSPASS